MSDEPQSSDAATNGGKGGGMVVVGIVVGIIG
jgi:hypothetical protein